MEEEKIPYISIPPTPIVQSVGTAANSRPWGIAVLAIWIVIVSLIVLAVTTLVISVMASTMLTMASLHKPIGASDKIILAWFCLEAAINASRIVVAIRLYAMRSFARIACIVTCLAEIGGLIAYLIAMWCTVEVQQSHDSSGGGNLLLVMLLAYLLTVDILPVIVLTRKNSKQAFARVA